MQVGCSVNFFGIDESALPGSEKLSQRLYHSIVARGVEHRPGVQESREYHDRSEQVDCAIDGSLSCPYCSPSEPASAITQELPHLPDKLKSRP